MKKSKRTAPSSEEQPKNRPCLRCDTPIRSFKHKRICGPCTRINNNTMQSREDNRPSRYKHVDKPQLPKYFGGKHRIHFPGKGAR